MCSWSIVKPIGNVGLSETWPIIDIQQSWAGEAVPVIDSRHMAKRSGKIDGLRNIFAL
jgi:hypothetical protein